VAWAKRVRWEEEPQRNERVFAVFGKNEGYGAGGDEKQEKALALSVRQGDHNRPHCGRFQGPGADAFAAGENCH